MLARGPVQWETEGRPFTGLPTGPARHPRPCPRAAIATSSGVLVASCACCELAAVHRTPPHRGGPGLTGQQSPELTWWEVGRPQLGGLDRLLPTRPGPIETRRCGHSVPPPTPREGSVPTIPTGPEEARLCPTRVAGPCRQEAGRPRAGSESPEESVPTRPPLAAASGGGMRAVVFFLKLPGCLQRTAAFENRQSQGAQLGAGVKRLVQARPLAGQSVPRDPRGSG